METRIANPTTVETLCEMLAQGIGFLEGLEAIFVGIDGRAIVERKGDPIQDTGKWAVRIGALDAVPGAIRLYVEEPPLGISPEDKAAIDRFLEQIVNACELPRTEEFRFSGEMRVGGNEQNLIVVMKTAEGVFRGLIQCADLRWGTLLIEKGTGKRYVRGANYHNRRYRREPELS